MEARRKGKRTQKQGTGPDPRVLITAQGQILIVKTSSQRHSSKEPERMKIVGGGHQVRFQDKKDETLRAK